MGQLHLSLLSLIIELVVCQNTWHTGDGKVVLQKEHWALLQEHEYSEKWRRLPKDIHKIHVSTWKQVLKIQVQYPEA